MASEFERRAAREAVDAVEQRWLREQQFRRRQQFRKNLVSFLSGAALLIMAGFAVIAFLLWKRDGNFSGFLRPCAEIRQFLAESNDRTDVMLDEYARAVDRLLSVPVKLSHDMPDEQRPKKASGGLSYLALCRTRDGRLSVCKLIADGHGGVRIWQMFPMADSVEVSSEDFKQLHSGGSYLVAVGDFGYLYGSLDLAEAETLRTDVRASVKR